MSIDDKIPKSTVAKTDQPDVAQVERFIQNYREYIAQTGHHVSMAHYSVLVQCKECRKQYDAEQPHAPKHEPYKRVEFKRPTWWRTQ